MSITNSFNQPQYTHKCNESTHIEREVSRYISGKGTKFIDSNLMKWVNFDFKNIGANQSIAADDFSGENEFDESIGDDETIRRSKTIVGMNISCICKDINACFSQARYKSLPFVRVGLLINVALMCVAVVSRILTFALSKREVISHLFFRDYVINNLLISSALVGLFDLILTFKSMDAEIKAHDDMSKKWSSAIKELTKWKADSKFYAEKLEKYHERALQLQQEPSNQANDELKAFIDEISNAKKRVFSAVDLVKNIDPLSKRILFLKKKRCLGTLRS